MSQLPRRIFRFSDAAFASEAAGHIQAQIDRAIGRGGACRIVLAGGRTPAAVYRALATRREVEWSKVHVFVGDERCVPPDHADSNFRMIHETLLSQVPIPPAQVHRLRGEVVPEVAAAEYDAVVAALPGPKFDIVINGMGADGHTASLFPGDQTILTETAWAVAAHAPPQFAVAQRLTLTLRALNSTTSSITFCTGDDKRTVRNMILAEDDGTPSLPASLLRGLAETWWFVDDR